MNSNTCIIVNALPRSGSNILWNIIASHPRAIMTRRETVEVVQSIGFFAWLTHGLNLRFLHRHYPGFGKMLCQKIEDFKALTIQDDDHNESIPGQHYTTEDLEKSSVVLKKKWRIRLVKWILLAGH